MANGKSIVFDIRYRASTKMETVKRCQFNGLRLRESDGICILSLTSYNLNRNFSIDVCDIESVTIGGKIRKLRAPATQHRQREQELKFLLQNQRGGLDDPSLRSYQTDEMIAGIRPVRHILAYIAGALGFLLLSLPGLGVLAIIAGAIYAMVKMAHVIH